MKLRSYFLTFALLFSSQLSAQPGYTAAKAAQPTNSEWRNWTFVATAFVTAAAGIVAVAVDNGHAAH